MNPGNEQEVHSLLAQGQKGSPKELPYRAVYDAQHTNDESSLPGKLIRAEGQKAVKDKAVNEAFDNVGAVLKFYKEKMQWNSIDDRNADVISSVHFGDAYENACKCSRMISAVHAACGQYGSSFASNSSGCPPCRCVCLPSSLFAVESVCRCSCLSLLQLFVVTAVVVVAVCLCCSFCRC